MGVYVLNEKRGNSRFAYILCAAHVICLLQRFEAALSHCKK